MNSDGHLTELYQLSTITLSVFMDSGVNFNYSILFTRPHNVLVFFFQLFFKCDLNVFIY